MGRVLSMNYNLRYYNQVPGTDDFNRVILPGHGFLVQLHSPPLQVLKNIIDAKYYNSNT